METSTRLVSYMLYSEPIVTGDRIVSPSWEEQSMWGGPF